MIQLIVNLQFGGHSNIISRTVRVWIILCVHFVRCKRRADRTGAIKFGTIIWWVTVRLNIFKNNYQLVVHLVHQLGVWQTREQQLVFTSNILKCLQAWHCDAFGPKHPLHRMSHGMHSRSISPFGSVQVVAQYSMGQSSTH